MHVTSFELHEQTTFPGWEFPFRIAIRGEALAPRALPFDATFASQSIWALRPAMDGGGLVGFLDGLPAIDEELMFGFLGEELVGTGLDGRIPG
jgi:hypothetical protein